MLNKYVNLTCNFKEVPVESPDDAVKRLTKMKRKSNFITIFTTVQKGIGLDVKEFFGYKLEPKQSEVFTRGKIDFYIVKNKITAYVGVMASFFGGPIGDLI